MMPYMMSLAGVLVFCATLIYLSHAWKPVVESLLPVRPDALPAVESDPIPDDLLHLVNQLGTGVAEGDAMLREQTVALLYEKYDELGQSWDQVRMWSVANIPTDQGWQPL